MGGANSSKYERKTTYCTYLFSALSVSLGVCGEYDGEGEGDLNNRKLWAVPHNSVAQLGTPA